MKSSRVPGREEVVERRRGGIDVIGDDERPYL